MLTTGDMNSRRRIWRMWLEFFLITALGTALFRVLVEAIMVPFSRGALVDSTRLQTVAGVIIWIGTVAISYFAFRYVVGKSWLSASSDR